MKKILAVLLLISAFFAISEECAHQYSYGKWQSDRKNGSTSYRENVCVKCGYSYTEFKQQTGGKHNKCLLEECDEQSLEGEWISLEIDGAEALCMYAVKEDGTIEIVVPDTCIKVCADVKTIALFKELNAQSVILVRNGERFGLICDLPEFDAESTAEYLFE